MCVCPEYVLVPEDIQDKLVEEMKAVYQSFYPDGPRKSKSFSRIVGEHHAKRIKALLDNSKGTVVLGGETDVAEKYIAPTVIKDVKGDEFTLVGDLTIKGITKPVELEAEFNGAATDPFGNARIGFSAETEVEREDWGLTWNAALETGGVLVSEKVKLEFDVSAIRNA